MSDVMVPDGIISDRVGLNQPSDSSSRTAALRVVWLLPVAWFYWQPTLSEFTKRFPKTTIFTALFPGFAQGFADALTIQQVGQFRVVGGKGTANSYDACMTYLSPTIIWHLFKARPQLIFSNSFGIWTILALLLKPLGRWQVVIAYEGSSPTVDYCHAPRRLALRRWMVRVAAACITNSQAGQAYLTQILGASPERVFANPYEIPTAQTWLESDADPQANLPSASDAAQPITPEPIAQGPVFLFVGRVVPRKGLQTLLAACALLKEQGYSQYRVRVVGDGPQRETLEQWSRDHQLEQTIEWVGQVEYDRLSQYLHQADVFVFPTFEDTWGVAVLEGMLFGKAMLCSTGAGTAELIIDGDNGYRFEPGQPHQLADRMRQLLDQPETIALMGEQSRRIMANYTPERAANALTEVVECIVGGVA